MVCEWCQAQFQGTTRNNNNNNKQETLEERENKIRNKGDCRIVGYIVNFRFPSRFVLVMISKEAFFRGEAGAGGGVWPTL